MHIYLIPVLQLEVVGHALPVDYWYQCRPPFLVPSSDVSLDPWRHAPLQLMVEDLVVRLELTED